MFPPRQEVVRRRLPGFRFEKQAPPLTETLPRMDIAVFVGFAASGPIDTPVAVEDAAHFSAIFGDDAPLAWDRPRGEQVYAYLAPAVRAFFRNGGRRCWIIRVAGRARTNYYPIPGLAQVSPRGRVAPAFARARSAGSWSDPLQVSSALITRPVELVDSSPHLRVLELAVASLAEMSAGDLLRLTFRDEGYVLLFSVNDVRERQARRPQGIHPTSRRTTVHVAADRLVWFRTRLDPDVSLPQGRARIFLRSGTRRTIPVLRWEAIQNGQSFVLDLPLAAAHAPTPGSLLRVDFGREQQLWLTVQTSRPLDSEGSSSGAVLRVTGEGLWLQTPAPEHPPISAPIVERLEFELWARRGDDYPVRLSNFAFDPAHPHFWGALPTDEELYARDESTLGPSHPAVWQAASDPRFPLAGPGVKAGMYIPIGMPAIPDRFLRAVRERGSALKRDGLATFDASLFLDPDLVEFGTVALLEQADFVRYRSPSPRRLTGIHAALGLEEATVIAVPDAVHRGWTENLRAAVLPADDPPPLPRPEWWHFLPCDPPRPIPQTREPAWANFLPCGTRVISPPALSHDAPDPAGTFTLTWSSEPGARYILEEATNPQWDGAAAIYAGTENRLSIYGRSAGDYYYRARAVVDGASSDWGVADPVRVADVRSSVLNAPEAYRDDTLLAVQRALLRLCAARGDLLAVLALPEHYREDAAVAHAAALKSPLVAGRRFRAGWARRGSRLVEPLGTGEAAAFSYGALYHPWLIGREETGPVSFRIAPPDGAACGIIARRALARGAWIAPANELLTGVVALTPPVAPDRYLRLQEAQLNLIRHEPRGFTTLSADTLSDDVDLRPINVRRLLILLRRMALQLGWKYVFEPNDDTLRRRMQLGFEALLDRMYARGAFAGSTPATAFQVVTGSSINTPQSMDQGRFIVELRVAPALPMTFLTIRLLQIGDRGLSAEGP